MLLEPLGMAQGVNDFHTSCPIRWPPSGENGDDNQPNRGAKNHCPFAPDLQQQWRRNGRAGWRPRKPQSVDQKRSRQSTNCAQDGTRRSNQRAFDDKQLSYANPAQPDCTESTDFNGALDNCRVHCIADREHDDASYEDEHETKDRVEQLD